MAKVKPEYTRKACPACGDKPYHPGILVADGVCKACKQLLNEARSARDADKARSEGWEVVMVPPEKCWHWFPRFYAGERGHDPNSSREQLEKLMAGLIYAVSEPMGERGMELWRDLNGGKLLTNNGFSIYGPGHHAANPWQGCDLYRKMRPEVAQIIRDMYDAIIAVLHQTHMDGKTKGQNILRALADGELTIQELNERSLRD